MASVYPIGYTGSDTVRWYAESLDGATIIVGDIAPGPGAAGLAMNLAIKYMGQGNVSRVIPEWEYEPVVA